MAQETDINPVRVILGEIKQLDLLGLFNSKIRKKKKNDASNGRVKINNFVF